MVLCFPRRRIAKTNLAPDLKSCFSDSRKETIASVVDSLCNGDRSMRFLSHAKGE